MQKILFLSLVIIGIVLSVPAYADEINISTLSDLVENGKALDGTEAAMTVEMIGDVMNRGSHSWVNGLDSSGAMGLWIPADMASEIKILGNGKYKGDTFNISGTFHRACPEHGGDMDIHVSHMELTAPGYPFENTIPQSKIMYAVFLTLIALSVVGIFLKVRLN